jgi:hypothetical protein
MGKITSTFIPFYEKSILTDIKQKARGGRKGKVLTPEEAGKLYAE